MSINFLALSAFQSPKSDNNIHQLWCDFYQDPKINSQVQTFTRHIATEEWQRLILDWSKIAHQTTTDDSLHVQWIIHLFNAIYNNRHNYKFATKLVKGGDEPEYFAPKDNVAARIEFAHGFFQSALHEISHWCIAGNNRRLQDDFGYWYAPDGRNQEQQQQFERVEIKPQAVECLLSLALGRYFYVSTDNLNANFDTYDSTFAQDVFTQATKYLQSPTSLPKDAKTLIWIFYHIHQQTIQ